MRFDRVGDLEEEPSEHMLTVTFPNTVELSIDGESQTIANLIGAYKDVVMADYRAQSDLHAESGRQRNCRRHP